MFCICVNANNDKSGMRNRIGLALSYSFAG